MNVRSMKIRWAPLSKAYYFGHIIGYRVTFFVTIEEGISDAGSVSTDANTTEVTIRGLHSFTSYSVRVLAYNQFGNGSVSHAISAKTKPAGMY